MCALRGRQPGRLKSGLFCVTLFRTRGCTLAASPIPAHLSFGNGFGKRYCQGYVSFVTGEIEDARRCCASPLLLAEQRVDVSAYVEGCFGTADMVIITDKIMHIIDLKLGKGVEVTALQAKGFMAE